MLLVSHSSSLSAWFMVDNLTDIGKIVTAAGLGVRMQERLGVGPHPWNQDERIRQLTKVTRTNASSAVSALHEYTERFDTRIPDFNLGACILTVTRLAGTMKQHGVYWCWTLIRLRS